MATRPFAFDFRSMAPRQLPRLFDAKTGEPIARPLSP
jgi:hypothetical protein